MNVVGIAKTLVNTIKEIENKATEEEFYELQDLISKENVDLISITKEVLAMEEKINMRDKTEKYRINISDNGRSLSILLTQDMTVKQLVELLEQECQSDILRVQIDYISREI